MNKWRSPCASTSAHSTKPGWYSSTKREIWMASDGISRRLTFDMSGGLTAAKRLARRPLDGRVRRQSDFTGALHHGTQRGRHEKTESYVGSCIAANASSASAKARKEALRALLPCLSISSSSRYRYSAV